jgi:hypothetical protein
MRLMVVAPRSAPLTRASKLAQQLDTRIVCADGVAHAICLLCTGSRADVLLIDYTLALSELQEALCVNRQAVPIIACGPEDAIYAGASDYLPVPANVQELAALIRALALEDGLQLHEESNASIH